MTNNPDVVDVTEAARAAMAHWPFARTGVTNPANGSAPYSWVLFMGQRMTFHDGEYTLDMYRDAGTAKAAAYAQAINDAAFELANHAALTAEAETQRLREQVERLAMMLEWACSGKGGWLYDAKEALADYQATKGG